MSSGRKQALDRVVLSKKAEPAIDWSEIESRLQDISNPSQSLSELSASDVPIGSSLAPAKDPPELIDRPGSSEPLTDVEVAMIAERDPLDMLSRLAALSPNAF